MPRVGSLCSGYEGISLGLTLAGLDHELAFVADTDPGASTLLAHRFPHVANLDDITAADWSRWAGRRADRPTGHGGRVDVLTGGVPCQGWSLAGKRKGSLDERDLWPVRKVDENGQPRRGAVDAIRALRPTLFVFENVASLVSAEDGVPFGQVLADLDELGYAVSWTVVGACRVGACHHRHRVFLAATLAPVARPEAALFGAPLDLMRKWPPAGTVVDGLVWERPAATCSGLSIPLLPTPTARDADRGAGWGDEPGRPLSEVVAYYRSFIGTKYEHAIRRHEEAFGRTAPPASEPGRGGAPRTAAAFAEWMQGLPAGWLTAAAGREESLRLAGNGVVPQQAAYALSTLPTFRAALAALTVEAVAA